MLIKVVGHEHAAKWRFVLDCTVGPARGESKVLISWLSGALNFRSHDFGHNPAASLLQLRSDAASEIGASAQVRIVR